MVLLLYSITDCKLSRCHFFNPFRLLSISCGLSKTPLLRYPSNSLRKDGRSTCCDFSVFLGVFTAERGDFLPLDFLFFLLLDVFFFQPFTFTYVLNSYQIINREIKKRGNRHFPFFVTYLANYL